MSMARNMFRFRLTRTGCERIWWRSLCVRDRSSCTSCQTSRIRRAPRCRRGAGINWFCWRTSTAFRLWKTIPMGSCAMKASICHHWGYSIGNVIYLSTFSKTLAPGLRLGWIVAPPEIIGKLAQLKQGADLHTSTFTQFVAYEVARDGFLDKHVKLIRQVYRERRDVMLEALRENFPPTVTWTHPHGGLFLWVTLPEGLDMQAIFQSAIEHSVAFVPGNSFYANNPQEGCRHMRLNFSNAAPEQIREGIARLAAAVKSHTPVPAPVELPVAMS